MLPALLLMVAAQLPPPLEHPPGVFEVLPFGGWTPASGYAPTLAGSRGEALTFTRSSTWGCAGDTEATWANVASNAPCVRPGGVALRNPTTNLLIRSEAMDNAAWFKDGSAGAPTVTANTSDVLAPDGTQTAEKVAYPAIGAGQSSRLYGAFTSLVAAYSTGVWLRTLSGTATVYLWIEGAGDTTDTVCSVTSTWTRCKFENKTQAAGTSYPIIGFDLSYAHTPAQTTQSAQTVYTWGGHVNAGKFAADYCGPTAGSTVACTTETLTGPTTGWPTSAGSVELTYRPTAASNDLQSFLIDSRTGGGVGVYITRETNNTVICAMSDGVGTNNVISAAQTWTAGARYRLRMVWSGALLECFRDGVSLGTTANPTRAPTSHAAAAHLCDYIGSTNAVDGLCSELVVNR